MKTIVLATANRHKAEEMRAIIADLGIMLMTLADFPGVPDVEETGKTFAENALIKARSASRHTGHPALGDDSGLEVDALGGAPGLYSARYAGEAHNYGRNNQKLLTEMRGIPEAKRTARFHCVLAYVGVDGDGAPFEKLFDGRCEGRIIGELRGTNGFGYDPLFFVPEFGRTMAELDPDVKNRISHRGRALAAFREFLLAHKGSLP